EADAEDSVLVEALFLLQVDDDAGRLLAAFLAMEEGLEGAAVGVDLDAVDAPVALACAPDPVLEESMPALACEGFELLLEVSDAEDAVLVLAVDDAHEVEHVVGAEALLDEADDLAAAVVGHGGEVHQVAVGGHVLDGGHAFAALPDAEVAVVAEVLAADVGEPLEAGGVGEELVLPTALLIGEAVAEVGGEALVHPRLG